METNWPSPDDLRMCEGVYIQLQGALTRVYFGNPAAKLPVRNRRLRRLMPVVWGRREKEPGTLPVGATIAHRDILAGNADRFFPKSVLVQTQAFAMRDFDGRLCWYDLMPGQWLHAAYLHEGAERRVYLLTVEPELPDLPHAIWPKVVCVP